MKKISYYLVCTSVLFACNSSIKKQPATAITVENNSYQESSTPALKKIKAADTTIAKKLENNNTPLEEKTLAKESDPIKEVVAKSSTPVVEKVKKVEKQITTALTSKKIIAKENNVSESKLETIDKQINTSTVVEKVISVPSKPSHEEWNKLTKNYVSKDGKVNYTAFKNNLEKIEIYLKLLENTPPTNDWSRAEKLSYWFNLYNASTVHLVATNYPVKSIKDINGGKPWDKKFIKSGSTIYSLNEIENTIVRPNYNEPRLHVAFNCAAVSCPNLLNEAFEPSKLNAQLNMLAKQWITDKSKNELDNPEKIKISQIFNWYKVDFKKGIIPFINDYATSPINESSSIDYLEYNWKLND